MQRLKIIQALCLLLFITAELKAQNWDENTYQNIERNIQAPAFPDRLFDITSYGASSQASPRRNQKAINKAIETCSKTGGGKVVIPEGVWNTGPITLKSNVNLVVQEGATLLFAFNKSLYPIVKTRWEGMDCMNYQPCIYAIGQENIAITGGGTIDGNATKETWWAMCGSPRYGWNENVKESQKTGRPLLFQHAENKTPIEKRNMKGKGLRPQLIQFYQCRNILLEGVTLLRSPFWVVHPLLSQNITVRDVSIINNGPNGDGCDPESCENVLIENCRFQTGDDCIAVKSGRNSDGWRWNIPSRNIIIRNCTMADGHGGVVIGSEVSGGCSNVFVENCTMDSPNLDRVLRLKTNTCRGGTTENIYMRNVKVGQCREAVLKINLLYEQKETAERGHIPTVRNVYMENVTCGKSKYGILINGLEESDNVYDIHLRNCSFNGVTDQSVKVTGRTHDIRFEKLFINGLPILSGMPYAHYSEWMTASEMQRTPHSYLLDFSRKPKWSYVMGIELEALLDTYLTYGNQQVIDYLKEYPDTMIDTEGNICGYRYEDFNLDNVRTARFLYRMNKLMPQKKIESALGTLFRQLINQPRTQEGVWWHKAIYANQVWLDGIYMGLPFYTLAAQDMENPRKYWDDAVEQITRTDLRTYDPATRLWRHAWDETRSVFWADQTTGQSQHTWGRALGWYVMAMLEVLEALPESYEGRQEIISLFRKAMTSVVNYQDKDTGVWFDVLDVTDKRNYLEASCSCMFSYALLKGVRMGYLDESFRQAGIKAYQGIVRNFIRFNNDGTLSLTRCCAVSGLGPAPGPHVKKPDFRRDGSFEYYISEPIRDNDAKGIAPFIWASLEMEKTNTKN